jgi:hypothetical protein
MWAKIADCEPTVGKALKAAFKDIVGMFAKTKAAGHARRDIG